MVKWNAQTYSSTVCEQSLMGILLEYNFIASVFVQFLFTCERVVVLTYC